MWPFHAITLKVAEVRVICISVYECVKVLFLLITSRNKSICRSRYTSAKVLTGRSYAVDSQHYGPECVIWHVSMMYLTADTRLLGCFIVVFSTGVRSWNLYHGSYVINKQHINRLHQRTELNANNQLKVSFVCRKRWSFNLAYIFACVLFCLQCWHQGGAFAGRAPQTSYCALHFPSSPLLAECDWKRK